MEVAPTGLYLEDSPSLSRYLIINRSKKNYRVARSDAMRETGLELPEMCPYDIETVINRPIDKYYTLINLILVAVR